MIDCVIGAATGYTEEEIKPFLKSLRLSGYAGKIILFADGGAAKEAEEWVVDIRKPPKIKTVPHAERFYWIADAISGIDCHGIFAADTRDVIFQTNPAFLPASRLHAYEEDDSMTIGSCPYNSKWIEVAYGNDIMNRMAHHPISCVGTICGDKLSMALHMLGLKERLSILQPKTKEYQDQAAHNHMIRALNFDGVVHNNEEGHIYTVGYIPREAVAIDGGMILNKAGDVPIVIHQWDRHQNLSALVKEKYL